MSLKISTLLQDEVTLNDTEKGIVDELIPIKQFSKGNLLLKEGQIAKNSYFLVEGLIRSYQILNGKECTADFYTEGSAITIMDSYLNQTPSRYYLECLEDVTLAELNVDKEKELYKKLPKMEALCRVSIENEYAQQQNKISDLLTLNAEHRYIDLLNNRPELLQRVSGLHLSSYLGIQPESLSRLRKRVVINKKL